MKAEGIKPKGAHGPASFWPEKAARALRGWTRECRGEGKSWACRALAAWRVLDDRGGEGHPGLRKAMSDLLMGCREDKEAVLGELRVSAADQHKERANKGKKGWTDWANQAWDEGGRDLYDWIKGRRDPPIVSATRKDGKVTLLPNEVAEVFTDSWAELWKPKKGHKGPWDSTGGWGSTVGSREKGGCPAITGYRVRAAIRDIGGKKAAGGDAWAFSDLKRLPDQATDELADLLNQIEERGSWPEELKGALVVMLPKGEGGNP